MSTLDWLEFPDESLTVNGLWWFEENSPELLRLPRRMEGDVRPEVWRLVGCPSGGRIRFSSDTTALSLRVDYESIEPGHNMSIVGRAGLDLYADGVPWTPAWPEAEGEQELELFEGVEKRERSFEIYLPLYNPVRLLAVGVDAGAQVRPAEEFAPGEPAAFYGSSITQGGSATRAGLSYQAQLGRMLDIDFVNLGFSGEGRGEPALARAFSEIDASVFVVDFAQNCRSADELDSNYPPFLAIIREKHPTTPVICITPIFSTAEIYGEDPPGRLSRMREAIREAVRERGRAGDDEIVLIEGTSLLGEEDADGLVDGVHPNDIGFFRMAERLAPYVAAAQAGA